MKFFRKSSEYSSPYSFCNFCNRKGHTQSSCTHKKHGVSSTYIWVVKGTYVPKIITDHKHKTNVKGPKKIWVPKGV